MWVVLGVLAGFSDALTWIQAELEDGDETPLIPDFLVARDTLIKNQIVMKNIKNELQSTRNLLDCNNNCCVEKWAVVIVFPPYGDPEVIRASDFLPYRNWAGHPSCP